VILAIALKSVLLLHALECKNKLLMPKKIIHIAKMGLT